MMPAMFYGDPDRSPVILLEEIFPGDTNAYGTAFGGRILEMIDRAAGLAASRFARCNFVTASLDAIQFVGPVRQGEIAEVEAKVVYTSSRTCGVRVRVFGMDKTSWERRECCEGLLFMVAVGPDGRAVSVPRFEPQDDEEQRAFDDAATVHRRMRGRRGVR